MAIYSSCFGPGSFFRPCSCSNLAFMWQGEVRLREATLFCLTFRLRMGLIFSFQITDDLASVVVAQLLFLQSESGKKPIHMYINSPGGSVTAGLGIYDTMQYIQSPVATWCVGQASSMGSLLLAAGAPGMRHSLPNARIMIHQPSGGTQVSCCF